LLASGYEVTASDISSEGCDYFSQRGIDCVRVDITQQDDFLKFKKVAYDVVINLAACQPANISAERYDPKDYVKINILGTLNILDFCRENSVKKIIYASSHRNTQGLWAANKAIAENEGRAIKYDGEYAMFSISESAAQDCIFHYQAQHGLAGIVFRLPPVYGYGPHTEIFKDGKPLKTGFQNFIDRARDCQPLEVWGDCDIGRDIIYIKDVVAAFLKAIEQPNASGLYNITSGVYLTLREQAEVIANIFWGSSDTPQVTFRPELSNGMDAFLYDNRKAARDLGWSPKYTFKDMLLDYIEESKSERYRHLLEKRLKMFN
jgi:UDP-glucose 4-epimerase